MRSAATAVEVDVDGQPGKSAKTILKETQPAPGPVDSPREWQRLGLSPGLTTQLLTTHPHFVRPTPTQKALIPSILSRSPLSDLILRSHTGSGKSFGILLALLSKPRLVFHPSSSGDSPPAAPGKPGISSILVVPTNELAMQYLSWARALFPPTSAGAGLDIDDLVRVSVRGGSIDAASELKSLRARPPHILICTPSRMLELLGMEGKKKGSSKKSTSASSANPTSDPLARSVLGLATLRTLVMDEVDQLLSLPPRFPSAKEVWKHSKHPPPGLKLLEEVMKLRPTCSGGEGVARNGLEMDGGRRFGSEQLPREDIRRVAHRGREKAWDLNGFAPAKERLAASRGGVNDREPWETPLQLVVTSATAGSVLRHFLGARTGWLRVESGGERDSCARWIDLTGLSGERRSSEGRKGNAKEEEGDGRTKRRSTMPGSLEHLCLVVDEMQPGGVRNLRLPERRVGGSEMAAATTSTSTSISKATTAAAQEESLLKALATVFALRGTRRGLALIPPTWSIRRCAEMLRGWGVDVRFVPGGAMELDGGPSPPSPPDSVSVSVSLAGKRPSSDKKAAGEQPSEEEATLYLLQSTSARGLDIPHLDDVFILGVDAVGDAVQYTHLAGRVGRLGPGGRGKDGAGEGRKDGKEGMELAGTRRKRGCVITLLPPAQSPSSDVATVPAATMGDGTAMAPPPASAPAPAPAPGEMRMAGIYKRLDVRLAKWKLRAEEGVGLEESEVGDRVEGAMDGREKAERKEGEMVGEGKESQEKQAEQPQQHSESPTPAPTPTAVEEAVDGGSTTGAEESEHDREPPVPAPPAEPSAEEGRDVTKVKSD